MSNSTTGTGATYTPIYQNGSRLEIRGMAATAIVNNLYRVSLCETCQTEVAWALSAKTGRWYVCETALYRTEAGGHTTLAAKPYEVHSCTEVADAAATREAELTAAEAAWYAAREAEFGPTARKGN